MGVVHSSKSSAPSGQTGPDILTAPDDKENRPSHIWSDQPSPRAFLRRDDSFATSKRHIFGDYSAHAETPDMAHKRSRLGMLGHFPDVSPWSLGVVFAFAKSFRENVESDLFRT